MYQLGPYRAIILPCLSPCGAHPKFNGAGGPRPLRRWPRARRIGREAAAARKLPRIATKIREIRISDQIRLCLFLIFYQIWFNGLGLDRFCAPEHIIEM